MKNSRQNVRMSRQQIEHRKRKRMQSKIFHLVLIIILAMLIFCVRNLNTRLNEMQALLKRLEPQSDRIVTSEEDIPEEAEEDYTGSIEAWDVGKPIERTEAEVLQRIYDLGQRSRVVEEIYQNSSLYPKDLLAALANNPEMSDFVSGYLNEHNDSAGGLTDAEKGQEHPLFLQWDPRWGYKSYGENCIGLSGCGPTCIAMALYYITKNAEITPDKIAEYSMKNGYYVQGTGTAWALVEDIPKQYGIKVTKLSAQASNLTAVLDSGGVIICSMSRGDFTLSGHYIVIYGYDSEGFIINDPNCVARSKRRWKFEELKYQTKNIWAYMPEGQDITEGHSTINGQSITEKVTVVSSPLPN